MTRLATLPPILCLIALFSSTAVADSDPMPARKSLSGIWRFQLDPKNRGQDERWYAKTLPEKCPLPGTTDENRVGRETEERLWKHLTRVYHYVGRAWYQRDVEIPESYGGKRILLHLERTKITRVWVDRQAFGTQEGLSAPQVYDLTKVMTPGRHVLTVMVDNSDSLPVGKSHALAEDTQTNWNGIVGRIELTATDPLWIDDLQVYPDLKGKKVKVRAAIGNNTGRPAKARLALQAASSGGKRTHKAPPAVVEKTIPVEGTIWEFEYALGDHIELWDEFSPAFYRLTAALSSGRPPAGYADRKSVEFGMRDFSTRGTQFVINGRPVFLRGRNDCCVFPLTGYAPMDVESWLRVLRIAQSYGLNHIRFHSWCPPEAAFVAADRLGVYLQPELPNWHPFGNSRHDQYMREEGDRILRAFGNHPSFVMFALGNENRSNRPAMAKIVAHFKRQDARHLYAQGSNTFYRKPTQPPGDDYWTTGKITHGKGFRPVRGSTYHGYYGFCHINSKLPSSKVDYAESIEGVTVPVIGHESGQYQVYPDYEEIDKYTGVLRAHNLEQFRDQLESRHMLDQDGAFQRASGILAAICYREEIEAALRTPGFGGFQLLDLQDFPGQGTALVGILDAFLDSKGLIKPERWREFCSPIVPLVRMDKYTWTTAETFTAEAQVAHYGPEDLSEAVAAWSIRDRQGREVGAGRLPAVDVPVGSVTAFGDITFSLKDMSAPQQLSLQLRIEGTPAVNRYDLWVYPPKVDTTPPEGIVVARTLSARVQSHLAGGGKVLLLPTMEKSDYNVDGAFTNDFWCFPMFQRVSRGQGIPDAPGTLGILCDEDHPALARFPTESHSNWQWWPIVKNARPMILDDTPPDYRPLVQAIDNPHRNHKLGLIFETKVGPGKMLVCTADLPGLAEQPAARQLHASLLAYVDSDKFLPATALDPALLKTWFAQTPGLARGKPATASSSAPGDYSAARGNDGNPNTRWCAANNKTGQWWQVDLESEHELTRVEIKWEFPDRLYQYLIEGSLNGNDWFALADRRANKDRSQVQKSHLEKHRSRYVRLTVTGLSTDKPTFACMWEMRVFASQE